MFLLDTNVLSELRRQSSNRANPHVVAWSSTADPETTFLSVITLMELEIGVTRIERRDPIQGRGLRQWFDDQIVPAFAGRILDIDVTIARRCGPLHVPDRRPTGDALIAATALVHGLTVVTRNTADFAPMGVALLNPWEPQV